MYHLVSLLLFSLIGLNPLLYGEVEQIHTGIYLASENNDKIGNNVTYLFDEVSGYFEVKAIKPANSNKIKGFSIVYYSNKEESWQFKFVIPARDSIVLGKENKYALSYPYQSLENAGIKVCRVFQDFNDLKGQFNILEYSLGPQDEITSLAIDFKQVAGNQGVLNGSIRYHSNKPLTTDFNSSGSDNSSDQFYPHFFELYSTPGDYVGGGKHVISEDHRFYPTFIWEQFRPNSSTHIGFRIPLWDGSRWLIADFRNPNGTRLEEGLYSNPDIWHKEPEMTSGIFEVLEVEYDDEGNLNKFAIDFLQYSLHSFDKPLRGTIRYNSYIPPSTEGRIKANLG